MLLKVENVKVNISGMKILENIDFAVNEGELAVVAGANGAGKSTLMRSIAGLQKIESGKIFFKGEEIQNKPPNENVTKGMSLVLEGRKLFGEMTVLENLELGGFRYKKDKQRLQKNIESMYEMFPILYKYKDKNANKMSGGEQQMLTIARGLMGEPELLLVDELSLGLAPKIIDMLLKTLVKLNETGISILLVEQNVKQALNIATHAYVLENGRIIASGTRDEVMNMEVIQKAYLGL